MTISRKNEVISFLEQLKSILENDKFDLDQEFILIRKNKKGKDEKYSTPYT